MQDGIDATGLEAVIDRRYGTRNVALVGTAAEPVVVIDQFSRQPMVLRDAAIEAPFAAAAHHYPGLRAPLPAWYLPEQMPVIADCVREAFGYGGALEVLDASFSIVSTPRSDLSIAQRLPHCDAFDPARIAFVHYLALDNQGGTAFYRHRSTGFETVDRARAPIFTGQLEAEIRHLGMPPADYPGEGDPLFERTQIVEARFNRAVLYRSYMLHSGSISPTALLVPDPAEGRLTVTGFLAMREQRGV